MNAMNQTMSGLSGLQTPGDMQGGAMPQGGMQPGATQGTLKNGAQPKDGWTCECGQVNTGKFCSECGKPAPAAEWICECGQTNKGKFCSNCGKERK